MNAREEAEAEIERRSQVMVQSMKTFPKTTKAPPPTPEGDEDGDSGRPLGGRTTRRG